jgi:glycosyltransferase involved in cell wall biosynthesis
VEFQLQFIGNGPDLAELQALADHLGLRDRVNFRGSLTRPDVARLLTETDVVVAPSVPTNDGRREGIPVALMEAMSSGLPVVASRLTGIPELVSDRVNGRLVPPRDSASLAEALEEMARNVELRERWGQAARESVEDRFDVRRNVQELLREIRRTARNKANRDPRPTETEVRR